ncbi:MAG: hypothetical protein J7L12_01205 [Desulfurococcales archaeon]|nr:hypothetical protein [Desulfurococcales archaeon]
MRSLAVVGLMLIIAGVLLVVASFLVGTVGEEVVGGAAGCIIIGPIPICFTGKGAATAAVLVGAVLIAVIFGITLYIILRTMKYSAPQSIT